MFAHLPESIFRFILNKGNAMKSAFSFLPRGFGSLLDYISPSAFDVIDWTSALKKSGTVSRELIFETSVLRLKEQMGPFLPTGVVFTSSKLTQSQERDGQRRENSNPLGQKLLEIYFLQIFTGQEVFLDLRKERFSAVEAQDIKWNPNGLWYKFSDDFIHGIRALYKGFYADSNESLQAGLLQLGLCSTSMSTEAKRELMALLEGHFGQGKSAPMTFRVSHFMNSFDSLFLFLKKHKLKLSEDFLFLGVYILTLYMHLESLGDAFDAASAYRLGAEKGAAKWDF
jgi:hypothetical protein